MMQMHAMIAALEEAPSDELNDLLGAAADNADTEEEKELWDAVIRYVDYLH